MFSGLRPGEKLYEELLIGDNASATEHPRIMVASEPVLASAVLSKLLDQIAMACDTRDDFAIRQILTEAKTGYLNSNPTAADRHGSAPEADSAIDI